MGLTVRSHTPRKPRRQQEAAASAAERVASKLAASLGRGHTYVFVKKTGGCPASKLDQELATILQPETQLSEANR